jgi:hypothetical protein
MFRRLTGSAALAASALTWTGVAVGQVEVRPGLWEVSISGLGDRTQTICLTPEMVKDMRNLTERRDPSSDCKPSKETISGNTRTFQVSCTKPVRYQANISMTLSGSDRFSIKQDFSTEVNGRTQRGSLSMTYVRIGECK